MKHHAKEWSSTLFWWIQLTVMMAGWWLWPAEWMLAYFILGLMVLSQCWSIYALDQHDAVRRMIRQRDELMHEYDAKIRQLRDQIVRDREDWTSPISYASGYPSYPMPTETLEHTICHRCGELHAITLKHVCTPPEGITAGPTRVQYPSEAHHDV